jgi:hypothetical protein
MLQVQGMSVARVDVSTDTSKCSALNVTHYDVLLLDSYADRHNYIIQHANINTVKVRSNSSVSFE